MICDHAGAHAKSKPTSRTEEKNKSLEIFFFFRGTEVKQES